MRLAGAGTELMAGAGVRDAMVTGIAAGAYAGAYSAEAEAARARKAKRDATTGFWRKLWVWVVG